MPDACSVLLKPRSVVQLMYVAQSQWLAVERNTWLSGLQRSLSQPHLRIFAPVIPAAAFIEVNWLHKNVLG